MGDGGDSGDGKAKEDLLGGSSLLTCMFFGAVFVNAYRRADKVLKLADSVTSPIYLLFFAVSGAGLGRRREGPGLCRWRRR